MTGDATTLLSSQISAAAACAYILNLIQKSEKIPWITQNTKYINFAIRALLAGAATIGIEHVWNPSPTGGGVLMITIPSLTVVVHEAWHWFGEYAYTHIAGQVLQGSTPANVPAAPTPPQP